MNGRAARIVTATAHLVQRGNLGVRKTCALVPSLTDDDAVARDDATDARIRARRPQAAARELQRARHVAAIGGEAVLHQRRARLSAGAGASTSFSASRKSDTSWNERYTEAKRM